MDEQSSIPFFCASEIGRVLDLTQRHEVTKIQRHGDTKKIGSEKSLSNVCHWWLAHQCEQQFEFQIKITMDSSGSDCSRSEPATVFAGGGNPRVAPRYLRPHFSSCL